MHQLQWDELSVEQKLEQLRLHQVAQDALIRSMLQALEGLGVTFTMGDESDPDA